MDGLVENLEQSNLVHEDRTLLANKLELAIRLTELWQLLTSPDTWRT
jgi:hypothetical protein